MWEAFIDRKSKARKGSALIMRWPYSNSRPESINLYGDINYGKVLQGR
jgi:hypothetical protein